LVDSYGPRTVMFVGTMLLSQLHSLWQLYLIFGLMLSIGKAANVIPLVATVLNLLFREFFGQKAIGSILGVFTAMSSMGMALGGYMGGVFHDRFDSYTRAFLLSLLAETAVTMLTFVVKPPTSARPRLSIPAMPQCASRGPDVRCVPLLRQISCFELALQGS
jgi:MFS family permease